MRRSGQAGVLRFAWSLSLVFKGRGDLLLCISDAAATNTGEPSRPRCRSRLTVCVEQPSASATSSSVKRRGSDRIRPPPTSRSLRIIAPPKNERVAGHWRLGSVWARRSRRCAGWVGRHVRKVGRCCGEPLRHFGHAAAIAKPAVALGLGTTEAPPWIPCRGSRSLVAEAEACCRALQPLLANCCAMPSSCPQSPEGGGLRLARKIALAE